VNTGTFWIVGFAATLSATIALAAVDPRIIALNEDGPYEAFAPYAASLKGVPFFYSSCKAERGPDYLIVPTSPSVNIRLIESHNDGLGSAATVINNAILRASDGELDVVESEGGVGSFIDVQRIADFLKTRPFTFSATGRIEELNAPEVDCP